MYEDILSNLIIKNIRSIATSYSGKNASGKRTKRERWSIIIKTEGETHYYSNGETFVSKGDTAIILPRGLSYEWKCIEAGSFVAIEFEMDYEYNRIISIKPTDMKKIFRTKKLSRNLWFRVTRRRTCVRREAKFIRSKKAQKKRKYYIKM